MKKEGWVGKLNMKIKFRGKTLDIRNENIETSKTKKYFDVWWNYFKISVIRNRTFCYESVVTNPFGEVIVFYKEYKTMKEAVQDAFNNIELDITEKEAMLTERNQLLQDKEITEEDLSEIEYWYGDVVNKYY